MEIYQEFSLFKGKNKNCRTMILLVEYCHCAATFLIGSPCGDQTGL